jgi:hypothetical protein
MGLAAVVTEVPGVARLGVFGRLGGGDRWHYRAGSNPADTVVRLGRMTACPGHRRPVPGPTRHVSGQTPARGLRRSWTRLAVFPGPREQDPQRCGAVVSGCRTLRGMIPRQGLGQMTAWNPRQSPESTPGEPSGTQGFLPSGVRFAGLPPRGCAWVAGPQFPRRHRARAARPCLITAMAAGGHAILR